VNREENPVRPPLRHHNVVIPAAPQNTTVSIETVSRAARALEKRLVLEIRDRRPVRGTRSEATFGNLGLGWTEGRGSDRDANKGEQGRLRELRGAVRAPDFYQLRDSSIPSRKKSRVSSPSSPPWRPSSLTGCKLPFASPPHLKALENLSRCHFARRQFLLIQQISSEMHGDRSTLSARRMRKCRK